MAKQIHKGTKQNHTHTPTAPSPSPKQEVLSTWEPQWGSEESVSFSAQQYKVPILALWVMAAQPGGSPMAHLKGCISQEVVQLFRDKFHWGTKRGFVHCLKNDALNLDLAFQFMLLETGQKWPSVLFSSFQVRQSGILLFLHSRGIEKELSPLHCTYHFCYAHHIPWNQVWTFIIVLILHISPVWGIWAVQIDNKMLQTLEAIVKGFWP